VSRGDGRESAAQRPEFAWVRENVLIEGLQDAVSLGEIHNGFRHYAADTGLSIHQIQRLTLDLVGSLVNDGLAVLGVPDRHGHFDVWDLPLDAAMKKITAAYIAAFDDHRSWTTTVWLQLTAKGEDLAKELYAAPPDG
jgi:hypothetical protein